MARTTTPAATRPAELTETAAALRLAIARLARQLRQQTIDGLTSTQLFTLATIERDGPLTLGELATAERVQPPTITNVVGKLEATGYVERVRDLDDGRVWRVRTSPAGSEYLADTRVRRTAWLVDHLRQLQPAELSAIERALPALERLGSLDDR